MKRIIIVFGLLMLIVVGGSLRERYLVAPSGDDSGAKQDESTTQQIKSEGKDATDPKQRNSKSSPQSKASQTTQKIANQGKAVSGPLMKGEYQEGLPMSSVLSKERAKERIKGKLVAGPIPQKVGSRPSKKRSQRSLASVAPLRSIPSLPSHLQVHGPKTMLVEECIRFTVSITDADGKITPRREDTLIILEGSINGRLYAGATCEEEIYGRMVKARQKKADFYYKAIQAGMVFLYASFEDIEKLKLAPASHSVQVIQY